MTGFRPSQASDLLGHPETLTTVQRIKNVPRPTTLSQAQKQPLTSADTRLSHENPENCPTGR